MNGLHLQIILTVAVVLGSAGLLLWSAFTIRYRITPTHLKITWLGLTVRRLRLDDIKRVGTSPVVWAERWPNTLRGGSRLLVIRRRSGWLRSLVITPEYPFEFRNELEQARKTQDPAASISSLNSPQDRAERRAA